MTDPSAQLIVSVGIHAGNSRTNLLYPFQILSTEVVVNLLSSHRRHEPGCAQKKIRVGIFRATLFLARHGMTGEEANAGVLAKDYFGFLKDQRLGATDVSEQSLWRQRGSEPLDQIDDSADGCREHDDLAATNRVGRIGVSCINCCLGTRTLENGRAVASDDSPAKPMLLQSQSERPADQARTDDRDLTNRHPIFSPQRHRGTGKAEGHYKQYRQSTF